jgi:hypothetical protein
MDSTVDNVVLQSRLHELEREIQYLYAQNAELRKEKEEIFYKWIKDDFIDMFMMYSSNVDETYVPSKDVLDKYWKLWKEKFNENWSSSDCHSQMMTLLEELMVEYPIVKTDNESTIITSPESKIETTS